METNMKSTLRKTWRGLTTVLVLGLTCSLGLPQQPPAPNRLEAVQSAGGQKMIAMEFYGLDIDHLLKFLSKEAGITIIKSEGVTGAVTVIAPESVPLDVAFQILNSILQIRGWTMMRTASGVYKVIAASEALQAGAPLQFGERPEDVPASDTYITQVIKLTNLSANDLVSYIQALIPAAVIVPTSTNWLIITDTATNIHKALTIISDLESQLSGGFRVFHLQYYNAEEMSDLVNTIVLNRGVAGVGGPRGRPAWEQRVVGGTRATPATSQPARPAGASMSAITGPEFCYPDVRTNSLIVLATPIHQQQIQNLIEQMDTPISLRESIFIYPVQNLVASDLAKLIGPLINAQVTVHEVSAPAGTAGTAGITTPRFPTTGMGGMGSGGRGFGTAGGLQYRPQNIRTMNSRSEAPLGSSMLEVEPLANIGQNRAPAPIEIAQAPEGVQSFPGPVSPLPQAPPPDITQVVGEEPVYTPGGVVGQATITADDNTNNLLISASPEQIDLLRQKLPELDVLPPQVHIQAIIAEVSLTRGTDLGFQWNSLGRTLGTFRGETFSGDILANFDLAPQLDDEGNPITPTGFFAEIVGSEFDAILRALTSDTHARILSTPGIFTSNNQRASIDVSNQRPFPTGTLSTAISGANTVSTSINYQSVGIVLEVTPRVTQGNVVQMEVSVSADEVGQPVKIGEQEFPSTLARRTKGTLHVKDGHTIVLGGLMRDTITRSGSKVPILGDLPLIGALFRSTRSNREKSELLIFLTPRVVRSPSEAARLTESEKQKMSEVPKSLKAPAEPKEAEP